MWRVSDSRFSYLQQMRFGLLHQMELRACSKQMVTGKRFSALIMGERAQMRDEDVNGALDAHIIDAFLCTSPGYVAKAL